MALSALGARRRITRRPERTSRAGMQVSQAVSVLGILEQLLDADPAAVPGLDVDGGALQVGHDGRVAVHLPEPALTRKAELLLGDGAPPASLDRGQIRCLDLHPAHDQPAGADSL